MRLAVMVRCWFPLWVLGLAMPLQGAERVRPLMKDFLGINGHTVQFRPELYRPVCGLVRDYHPVEWDLGKETGVLPAFPFAKNGVSWQQVYGGWKGWRIDASLMFESIPRESWTDVAKDANAYGRAVAKSFGPGSPTPLLESVEIGNEPGKWSDADYATMLKSMAEGIREGDAKLKIVTCNLTTGKSGGYEKSVACLDGLLPLVDVLNVHSYAQLVGWPTWKRSYPEDPALKDYLPDLLKLCAWRDEHCPEKPVWLTEYGYDSSTKPAPKEGDFAKWEGVDDLRQAQWLVRSTLVISALPVERAYVYFFDDNDEPQLHGSSGLTRHFQPKPSYHAMAQLQRVLGDFRFKRVVRDEPGKCRIQEYAKDGGEVVWAVWSPTGNGRVEKVELGKLPGELVAAERMSLKDGVEKAETKGDVLEMGEGPVYLRFKVGK